MKKYCKPSIETTELIYGSVLCASTDGNGLLSTTPGKTVGPNAVMQRIPND